MAVCLFLLRQLQGFHTNWSHCPLLFFSSLPVFALFFRRVAALEYDPSGGKRTKGPQRHSLSIGRDSKGQHFVKGATWVEVHSAEEAFAVLEKGQQSRRTADNNVNKNSSRSHSIFSVRLVSAPLNKEGSDVDRGADRSGRHPDRPPHVAEV